MLKPWKQKWTVADEATLTEMYRAGKTDAVIAAKLGGGFTPKAVYAKRARMRLIDAARGEKQKRSRAIMSADVEMKQCAIEQAHAQHVEDLFAAYPNGAPYMREKPTLGGARRYQADPSIMYRSPAAMLAEG